MIELLAEQERDDARRAFGRVFRGTSVLDAPFAAEIPARMLFWPDGRYMTEQQVGALGPATGDGWAYVGSYWFHTDGSDDFDAWARMDLADAAIVYAGPGWPDRLSHEHVIVGPDGDWGALLPESGDAVFGGAPEVVERFRRLAGIDEDEDIRETLAFWSESRSKSFRPAWLPGRLGHIYGEERAAAWLAGCKAFD